MKMPMIDVVEWLLAFFLAVLSSAVLGFILCIAFLLGIPPTMTLTFFVLVIVFGLTLVFKCMFEK